MLSKRNRLSTQHIRHVMASRDSFSCGQGFRVKYTKAVDSQGRLGIIISKKKVKKAFQRNKIRRRLYAELRPVVEAPYWVVVFIPAGIENQKDFKDLLICIQNKLKKLVM